MAASVYTGKNQDFTYTNSTGGNVRVIIYWLHAEWTSNQYVKLVWGNISGGSNDYVEYPVLNTNNGAVRMGKSVAAYAEGDRALNNMYATNSTAAPCEIFLANGHTFKIDADENSDVLGYNVVVIPES